MITTQELARQMCALEGLKEQVNIAQMNEIFSKLPELIWQNRDRFLDISQFLFREFMIHKYSVHSECASVDGEFNNASILIEDVDIIPE